MGDNGRNSNHIAQLAIDLDGDLITCYGAPSPDGYGENISVTRGATLRPVRLPEVEIEAGEILG